MLTSARRAECQRIARKDGNLEDEVEWRQRGLYIEMRSAVNIAILYMLSEWMAERRVPRHNGWLASAPEEEG